MSDDMTGKMAAQTSGSTSRRSAIRKGQASTVIYPLLFGAFLLALWEGGALNAMTGADSFTLPSPSRIMGILADNMPKIMLNAQATLAVALSGLILGSLLGYGIAMVASHFPKWGPGGLTVISAFNAVPIIAIAPILNNLTKDVSPDASTRSMVARILVVTITCTVAMSMNAYRGFTELKPFSVDLLHSFAAKPRAIFLKLKVPNSIPYVFTALRISVPGSIIGAMVSEYFAEYIIGVGRQIRENIVLAQYATAWAYIVTAIAMGLSLYAALLFAEGILLRWRRKA
jgi:NitT/TauT family transport system permease protein